MYRKNTHITIFSKNNGSLPKELFLYCELSDVTWIHGNTAFAISFSVFRRNLPGGENLSVMFCIFMSSFCFVYNGNTNNIQKSWIYLMKVWLSSWWVNASNAFFVPLWNGIDWMINTNLNSLTLKVVSTLFECLILFDYHHEHFLGFTWKIFNSLKLEC